MKLRDLRSCISESYLAEIDFGDDLPPWLRRAFDGDDYWGDDWWVNRPQMLPPDRGAPVGDGIDTNGDGIPDFQGWDLDGDGIQDIMIPLGDDGVLDIPINDDGTIPYDGQPVHPDRGPGGGGYEPGEGFPEGWYFEGYNQNGEPVWRFYDGDGVPMTPYVPFEGNPNEMPVDDPYAEPINHPIDDGYDPGSDPNYPQDFPDDMYYPDDQYPDGDGPDGPDGPGDGDGGSPVDGDGGDGNGSGGGNQDVDTPNNNPDKKPVRFTPNRYDPNRPTPGGKPRPGVRPRPRPNLPGPL